jgi:hypothetical protein
MNPITDIWKQLVRRRLWPVAVLLVAALAAVPFVLAKEPEPAPPAPPAPANTETASTELAENPIVAPGAESDANTADRKPLGKHHDIFKPTKKAPKPAKAAKTDDASTDTGSDTPKDESSSGSGGSTGGGAAPTAPATPTTPVEPEKPKTYPLYSLKVRFGGAEDSGKRILPKLGALPSADEPMVVYLGLLDDKKTAVFMLDASLTAIGDGACHPSPENCETVRMREGDTMFFDPVAVEGETGTGTQYELELIDIHKKQTTDAAKAAKSAKLAKVASAAAVGGGLGQATPRRLGVIRNG